MHTLGKPQKVLVRITNGSPKFMDLFFFYSMFNGEESAVMNLFFCVVYKLVRCLQKHEFVLLHGDHILLQIMHTGYCCL